MCGTKDKPCCTCFCGDGGCLASMREDFYMPATEEQVRERLENGSYPKYRDVMKTYLEMKIIKRIREETKYPSYDILKALRTYDWNEDMAKAILKKHGGMMPKPKLPK